MKIMKIELLLELVLVISIGISFEVEGEGCNVDGVVKADSEKWFDNCQKCECSKGVIRCFYPDCSMCHNSASNEHSLKLKDSAAGKNKKLTEFHEETPNFENLITNGNVTALTFISKCCSKCEYLCPNECLFCSLVYYAEDTQNKTSLLHKLKNKGKNSKISEFENKIKNSKQNANLVVNTQEKDTQNTYSLNLRPKTTSATAKKSHIKVKMRSHYANLTQANLLKPKTIICVVCKTDFLLKDGKCVKNFPKETFRKEGNCFPCQCESCINGLSSPCKRKCNCEVRLKNCEKPENGKCQICVSAFFLLDGKCLRNCPPGFYTNDKICRKCHQSCKTCNGSAITSCLSCHSSQNATLGYQYKDKKNIYSKKPNLVDNSWHNQTILSKIESLLNEKSTSEDLRQNFDLNIKPKNMVQDNQSRKSDLKQQKAIFFEGRCLVTCPKFTFAKREKCLKCHEDCAKCVSTRPNGCLKCKKSNNYLIPNSIKTKLSDIAYQQAENFSKKLLKYPHTWSKSRKLMEFSAAGICRSACPHGFEQEEGVCFMEIKNRINSTGEYVQPSIDTEILRNIISKSRKKRNKKFNNPDFFSFSHDYQSLETDFREKFLRKRHLKIWRPNIDVLKKYYASLSKNKNRKYMDNFSKSAKFHTNSSQEILSSTETQKDDPRADLLSGEVLFSDPKLENNSSIRDDSASPKELGISVLEGQAATITTDDLSFPASDQAMNLIYTLTSSLGQSQGSLINIDSPGLELRQFTQYDVDEGKIIYMPPFGDLGVQEKVISFKFSVSSVINGVSQIIHPEKKFHIRILPQGENAMRFLHEDPEFILQSLETIQIPTKYFQLVDTPNDPVSVFLLEAPQYGFLSTRKINEKDVSHEFNEDSETSLQDLLHTQIFYTNMNGKIHRDSAVILLLGLESEATRKITFLIKQRDDLPPVPDENAIFSLVLHENTTKLVTSESLHYTDSQSEDGEIVYTISTMPIYGSLQLTKAGRTRQLDRTSKFRQSDIVDGTLSYRAKSEIGNKKIYDNVHFNVTDSHNNALWNQLLKIEILPKNNQAPDLQIIKNLTVSEGSMVEISSSVVLITDADSSLDDISIVIDTPPLYGFLTNSEKETNKLNQKTHLLRKFSFRDVVSNRLKYVQSRHRNNEPKYDHFSIHLSDGINKSPVENIYITIQAVNDETPILTGQELTVKTGETLVITKKFLNIHDLDTKNKDIRIMILKSPEYGILYIKDGKTSTAKLDERSQFSYGDVLQNKLVYTQDGSKAERDSIQIEVSDGVQKTGGMLEIKIEKPKGNKPMLILNQPVVVRKGKSVILQPNILTASDQDRLDSSLVFVLESKPKFGRLEISKINSSRWKTLSDGHEFSQKDVNLGRVRYISGKSSQINETEIYFTIKGRQDLYLTNQVLRIIIKSDKNPPIITKNELLNITKYSLQVITSELLSVSDEEAKAEDLTFKLIQRPVEGQLEHLDHPHKEIRSWTQKDLELGNVAYRHMEKNSHFRDRFFFEVFDGENKIFQTFRISIHKPKRNKITVKNSENKNQQTSKSFPPYLIVNQIEVEFGKYKIIDEKSINAKDPDSKNENLVFTLHKKPKHGRILVRDKELDNNETFTLSDISTQNLIYVHGGKSATDDKISLSLSDGENEGYLIFENEHPIRAATELSINIIEVMATVSSPMIVKNEGISFLQLKNGKAQNFITPEVLEVKDLDTAPEHILFKVTHKPKHGTLRANPDDRAVHTFSQYMINHGDVYYELDSWNENLDHDQFLFKVSDVMSNDNPENIFLITWSWVFMDKREYNISKSENFVRIAVKKSGNLENPSAVHCQITDLKPIKNRRLFRPNESNKIALKEYKSEINFSKGENRKFCQFEMKKLKIYDKRDQIIVKLTDAKHSLIGRPKKSFIHLVEGSQKSVVAFTSNQVDVNYEKGMIKVPVTRSGDLKNSVFALCIAKMKHAKAYKGIKRIKSEASFKSGAFEATCDFKFDASKFKDIFEIQLLNKSEKIVLGEINQAVVKVEQYEKLSLSKKANKNENIIYRFEKTAYNVSENAGSINLEVFKHGNLKSNSSVWCHTKSTNPIQAQPNKDYYSISNEIKFEPGRDRAEVNIKILDDKSKQVYEGSKSFIAYLDSPKPGKLDEKYSRVLITIHDESDKPYIKFESKNITVNENQAILKVPIIRNGDLEQGTEIYCYTVEQSASSEEDYVDRPMSEKSVVKFPKGTYKAFCEIEIIDDKIYESNELFYLKITHTEFSQNQKNKIFINSNPVVQIRIVDPEDKPQISFRSLHYSVLEPKSVDTISNVEIPVVRYGDTSQSIKVMVSAKGVSALENLDFREIEEEVKFPPGVTKKSINISILYNRGFDTDRLFKVIIEPQSNEDIEFLGPITSTTISIEKRAGNMSSNMPNRPVIVSLVHYKTSNEYKNQSISSGYPIVCVDYCDKFHPDYDSSKSFCKKRTEFEYTWEISSENSGLLEYNALIESTFFGNTSTKVLDSMFFAAGNRIRCVLNNKDLRFPVQSTSIRISERNTICDKSGFNLALQNQDFMAKLKYVNFTDEEFPNMIKVEVETPHQDGMIPLLSTFPLHNIKYLLNDDIYRNHHMCSNLHRNKGFLSFRSTKDVINSDVKQDIYFRTKTSRDFYQHLDLEECRWSFVAYYSMSDLVDNCGGQIVSDFQVDNNSNLHLIGEDEQSFLTVKLPLYVSYAFIYPGQGWSSIDHRTELSVSLYYSSVLWNRGIDSEPELSGKIQDITVSTKNDEIIIEIKTKTKFRGRFVLNHSLKSELLSSFLAPETNLNFTLDLIKSEESWDEPEQVWRATTRNIPYDYTGNYVLQLVPCTVFATQSYHVSEDLNYPKCIPQWPVNFTIPISLERLEHYVPEIYTLDANFLLFNNVENFLLNLSDIENFEELDYKGRFALNQKIYGKVVWNMDTLTPNMELVIDKVYICSGKQGYVPKYDPDGILHNDGPQYGCSGSADELDHSFLILDRSKTPGDPGYFENYGIEAHFADDIPEMLSITDAIGIDGFIIDTNGLYNLNAGYNWFIQVMYTIEPAQYRGRRKTPELENESLLHVRNLTKEINNSSLETNKFTSPINGSNPMTQEFQKISSYNFKNLSTLASYNNLKVELVKDSFQKVSNNFESLQNTSENLYINLARSVNANNTLIENFEDLGESQNFTKLFENTTNSSDLSRIERSKSLALTSENLNTQIRNGTNIRSIELLPKDTLEKHATKKTTKHSKTMLISLYISISVVLIILIIVLLLIYLRKHYKLKKDRQKVIIVRTYKKDTEDRSDDMIVKNFEPVTLNSESNLHRVKVKTLAVTVKNNFEEAGTEV